MSNQMTVVDCLKTWLLMLVLLAGGATAQIVPGEYIVELSGDPVSGKGVRTASARATVQAAQARVETLLVRRNVEVLGAVDTVLNALAVRTDDASALNAVPGVARVYPVRLYKPVMDRAVGLHNLPLAGALIGGSANAGAGIRIGIIDTGVDASHTAFRDEGFQTPDGFPRFNKDTDRRYTNNKVIVARNYDTSISSTAADRKGHGTSVAAVAAAVHNIGPSASFAGVAPKAYIGSYKVFPDAEDSARNSTILQALNDAVNDGMDVVNLSLGSLPAPRPEDDPLVKAIENATRAGVVVVIAAGNEGPGLATIGSPGTAPSAITVGASVNDRIFAASVSLDGLEPLVGIPGSASGSAGQVNGSLVDVRGLDPSGLLCNALPASSLTGSVVFVQRGQCTFEVKLNFAQEAGAIAAVVATHSDQPAASTMSMGSARLPAMMIGYADGLRASQRLQNGVGEVRLDFARSPVLVNSASLADFTSKGPSVDSRIKPDLLAVGTSLYTAKPVANGAPSYSSVQGTSFSAPMVAGAAALLKAFRPGLGAEEYKSLLVNSASTFLSQEGVAFPMQHTGSGLLDVAAAVRLTVAANPSGVDFGVGGSTANLTRRIVLKNLSGVSDTFSVTVAPAQDGPVASVSPDVVHLPPGGTAELLVRWTAAALAPRAYEGFVIARGTQNDAATRIPYWYAAAGAPVSSVAVFESPESGKRSSRQDFLVRALDASGVPVMIEPKVTVLSDGPGTLVSSIESYDHRYPGFYRVNVVLSSERGANIFEVQSGPAKVQVTIAGTVD